MQEKIDKIIYSNQPLDKKLRSLSKLFCNWNFLTYSDLDDTITHTKNIFYSKVFYLISIKRQCPQKSFKSIIGEFKFNPKFLKVVDENNFTNMIIISRNNHEFVKYFIKTYKSEFEKLGINLVGGMGRAPSFKIRSKDKLKLLPPGATIVSDILENHTLGIYNGFISVDKFSLLFLMKMLFMKGINLGFFILKDIFKGIFHKTKK